MNVERVGWEDYLPWLRRRVRPGQHAVIIGSTGSGKSELAKQVVPLFGRNIVLFDGKGGDDPGVAFPGFDRITAWPPRAEVSIMRALTPSESRRPIRVSLAPSKRRIEDLARNRAIFSRALDDLFTRRGSRVFTLYVDELGELADPRKMGLGPKVQVMLEQMRYRGGSVITSMQYPAWLPKPAYRETTHRFIFRVYDEDSLKFLASITGARAEVLPTLGGLRRFEFLHQDITADRMVVSKVRMKARARVRA